MCSIAPVSAVPAVAAPAPAAPTTGGGPTPAAAGAQLSTDGVTPIPSVLQPSSGVGGVSGGGQVAAASPELQAVLQQLWGAIGSLQGAIDGMTGVSGGGGSASGCACQQAGQGVEQLPPPGTPTQEPPASPPPSGPAPTPPPAPTQGPGQAPKGFKIKHPLPGAKLTSHYGEVASIRGGRPHTGTDLAKPSGTPILSAAPGKILKVGFEGSGLGNYVYVDHGNGWVTRYGHMVEKSPLKEGDVVDAGTQIGKVGSTGNSTGPHLHFMVVKDGQNQNPEPFLNGEKTF